MKKDAFISLTEVLGHPWALAMDYIDHVDGDESLLNANDFLQCKADEESSYNAQARWDARCQQGPMMPVTMDPIDGSGFAGMIGG